MSRQLLVTACSLGLAEQHVSAVAKVYSELGNVSLVPKAAKILQPETDSSKRAKVALIGLGTKGLGMAKGEWHDLSELIPSAPPSRLQRPQL